MPRPTWMSGEVTSMPSLTRSGRPSLSLASSPPSGRTSTALRVSDSRADTPPSILLGLHERAPALLDPTCLPDAGRDAPRQHEQADDPVAERAEVEAVQPGPEAGRERELRRE